MTILRRRNNRAVVVGSWYLVARLMLHRHGNGNRELAAKYQVPTTVFGNRELAAKYQVPTTVFWKSRACSQIPSTNYRFLEIASLQPNSKYQLPFFPHPLQLPIGFALGNTLLLRQCLERGILIQPLLAHDFRQPRGNVFLVCRRRAPCAFSDQQRD